MRGLITILFMGMLSGCASSPNLEDNYLWLEEVEGEKALKWAKARNSETEAKFAQGESYEKLKNEALEILEFKDKIPAVDIKGNYVYNFWQGSKHVRGILRRMPLKKYGTCSGDNCWSTVLDIDRLAKIEKENWVYGGMSCLKPGERHCMVELSRGGKDAATYREFDTKTLKFVRGGFRLEEAKSFVNWIDKDTIFVGTDFGKGSVTDSGYPRTMRVWERGKKLSQAEQVFQVLQKDVLAYPQAMGTGKDKVLLLTRMKDFFTSQNFIYDRDSKKLYPVPVPESAALKNYINGQLIFEIRKPFDKYLQGDLVAVSKDSAFKQPVFNGDYSSLKTPTALNDSSTLIFRPSKNQSFKGLAQVGDHLIMNVLNDVMGTLMITTFKNGRWTQPMQLKLPVGGNIKLSSSQDVVPKGEKGLFTFFYEAFNKPKSYYFYELGKGYKLVKTLKHQFDSSDIVVSQKFAKSKDGTKVPYFLVHKKDIKFNSKNPTLLYGYGGFNISLTPSYSAVTGKLFLEKGGVYALANIRGGGEYGPKWHMAALKHNRQKAYDDFIAVAENLIKKNVTSNQHLAIRGGSNGGLLMGVMLTQRPDLFRSVLCWVPLLDMIRFSKLLAGASWMGEYGNPEIAEDRKAILKYSPYQNVKKNKTYPETLFVTSTKDDRVHPGHARKMAARMMGMGHNVHYFENIEGGHKASANLKQQAALKAMEYEFLQKTIF